MGSTRGLKMAKLVCLVAAMLLASAAAPCSPEDVSIVQDNAFNDMASSFVQTYSGVSEDKVAVFTAEFRLYCKSEQLKDVPVHASISYRSGSGAFKPVATLSDVAVIANAAGPYQISFVLPDKDTSSGEYKADIFFAGEDAKAASISIMHSNPVLSGRHLEILALLALGLNAFYVQSKFAVSQ